jgi:hypothetical protein
MKRASFIFVLAMMLRQAKQANAVPDPPGNQNLQNSGVAIVQVCHRPLPKWTGSRNWLLRILNGLIVRHIHHSYISFATPITIASTGIGVRTIGIHPLGPANKDKEPMPDQITDTLENGGECKIVRDISKEKVKRLLDEIAATTCYSCGNNYHNRVLSGCYNNSNTYVYDLIAGAGMTPPAFHRTPGYRHHHQCHF